MRKTLKLTQLQIMEENVESAVGVPTLQNVSICVPLNIAKTIEIVEVGPITPQGLVQNHTVEQFVGVHTPKSVKIRVHQNMKDVEIVEVGKITPHERVKNRTMETVDCVDVTMPPGMKQTVDITVSVSGRCGHRGGGAKQTTRSMKNRVEKSSIACS